MSKWRLQSDAVYTSWPVTVTDSVTSVDCGKNVANKLHIITTNCVGLRSHQYRTTTPQSAATATISWQSQLASREHVDLGLSTIIVVVSCHEPRARAAVCKSVGSAFHVWNHTPTPALQTWGQSLCLSAELQSRRSTWQEYHLASQRLTS